MPGRDNGERSAPADSEVESLIEMSSVNLDDVKQASAAAGEAQNNPSWNDGGTCATRFDYPPWPVDNDCISSNVPAPCCYQRQVGRMYVFLERKRASGDPHFLCVAGPCWPMCFVTWLLIVGISVGVFTAYLHEAHIGWVVAGYVLLVVTAVSLALTGCTDPGIMPRSPEQQDPSWTWSDKGRSYRPPGCVYDQESQVIIRDIDHFCPWTGTVIAGGNMRYFVTFVSTLCALIIFVAIVFASGMMTNN